MGHETHRNIPRSCGQAGVCAQLLFAVAMLSACGGDDAIEHSTDPNNSSEDACPWDDDDRASSAGEAELEAEISGYLCPIEDVDFYRFTVPKGKTLLKVELSLDAPASAVNPTYAILDADGNDVIAQPDPTESVRIGAPLSITHRVAPGDYLIRINDQSRDGTDNYHPYLLKLTGMADRDANEPNDEAADATSVSDEIEGYLSYRGDEDWYALSVTDTAILEVTLSMDRDGRAPAYRIEDENGTELVTRPNRAGEAEVSHHEALSGAGKYYLVVYYEDPLRHSPDAAYTLSLESLVDPDPNEGNDTVAEATPLSAETVTCGQEWQTLTATGYIATSGDTDWFVLNLASCGASVVDVSVDFDRPDSLPEGFEAAVRLVRSSNGSACTADQQCQELTNRGCAADHECAYYGNNCLPTGRCGGAGICLPNSLCGATLIARNAAQLETSDPDFDPGAPVTPGSVRVGAPLPSIDRLYIAVEDYKGDALSVEHEYTLTVRVAKDTDPHEPSEAYMNRPATRDDPNGIHLEHATTVPVEDCTAAPESCCGDAASWVEGAISYTFDQDWYYYEHPCPESDCLLQIHYDLDAGPTDFLMAIYLGGSLWYDTIVPVSDTGNQAAKNGVFGDDECFYAYRDHSGYYFNVRDTLFVSEGSQNHGTWDWSRDQKYRFCIAKYSDTCASPCQNDPEWGCGFP